MQFDLKQADLYFVDGHTNSGLVNILGNYAIGIGTIAVDGHTGIIVTGTTFTKSGDGQTYTVTAHSETLGNTTSLTFTPVLAVAANDNATLTLAKSASGAINHGAGYTSGTTAVVDGFTGIIPVGAVVTIGADPGSHVVTSTVETLGNTTTINFTVAIASTVNDDDVVSYTYASTAAVNKVGGYAIGIATMAVDGITGSIPDGATFQLASDTEFRLYSIVSASDTLGNTTSITFTPALVEAVTDDEVITFLGRTLRMKIGDGTMTYDEKRTVEYKKDRGKLDTVRLGDEEPTEIKLDLRWEFLRSDVTDPVTSSIPSPEEVMKKVGAASGWETSAEDPCEPYAVDIYVIYTPLCEDVKKETILLKDFRYVSISHDFKGGMLSTSGTSNSQEAVVLRV